MMNKRWLAALANSEKFRIRRVQAVCYMSLLLNIVFLLCMLAIVASGR